MVDAALTTLPQEPKKTIYEAAVTRLGDSHLTRALERINDEDLRDPESCVAAFGSAF